MMRYAQIDEANICIGISELDGQVDAPHLVLLTGNEWPLGQRWEAGLWVTVSSPVPVRIDTPLFIMRFTPEERIAMRTAAKSGEPYAALVDDWLQVLYDPRLAYVELGDPNLLAAVAMMVQVGLLTQTRADAVMMPAPQTPNMAV